MQHFTLDKFNENIISLFIALELNQVLFFLFKIDKFKIDWNRILEKDPLHCAQSLICQIIAGTEKENEDAIIMSNLIE